MFQFIAQSNKLFPVMNKIYIFLNILINNKVMIFLQKKKHKQIYITK